jgi:salicylate hydroxylase
MQHNTSFGFEDAETLGYLFSRIPSRSLIPRFLMAYEEIRSTRIANASAIDVSLLQSSITQKKLLQGRLDTLMTKQESSTEGDADSGIDDELMGLWSETLSMWLYDANEKVDDWWSKWGPGIVREDWEPGSEATAIYVAKNVSHQ